MNGSEPLQSLETRGLRFQLDGEALNVRPRKLITDEVRQIIRDHKDALIATLRQRDASAQRKPLSPDERERILWALGDELQDIGLKPLPLGLLELHADCKCCRGKRTLRVSVDEYGGINLTCTTGCLPSSLRTILRDAITTATEAQTNNPPTSDQSTSTPEATSTPQDIARLDAERNERDRKNRRGYDYDGRSRTVIKASEHVDLVIDAGEFGNCEVCGDPAGIVLPWNAAVNGKRHFCGGACWNKAKADASGDGR